jgi:hypothetical protein
MTSTVHTTCRAKLLRIIVNVLLEPGFLPFLGRNLKYWNDGRYMPLRKWVRSNGLSSLVLMAGARALAGNVSDNLGLVASSVRCNGAHNRQRGSGRAETQ